MKNRLFKKYKAVAFLPTAYAVLQYMLLQPHRVADTLFLIEKDLQKDLMMRLPHFYKLFTLNLHQQSPLVFRLKRYWCYLFIYILSKRCETIFLSSNPIFIDAYIYYFDHIIYLEDGCSNYRVREVTPQPQSSWLGKWRHAIFGPLYTDAGWADKVEKIYLTGILPIPDGIAAKVELFNLKKQWDKRSPDEQQEIIRLFLPEGVDVVPGQEAKVLLLTQPLSEDLGAELTEEDKIGMYRVILSGIEEQTVLIKPHPRERTDYRKYFPQATVLNQFCPMELLNIMGLKTKKAITVRSTAIYSLDDSVEKVIVADNPPSQLKKIIALLTERNLI